jgi:hypothetical protein
MSEVGEWKLLEMEPYHDDPPRPKRQAPPRSGITPQQRRHSASPSQVYESLGGLLEIDKPVGLSYREWAILTMHVNQRLSYKSIAEKLRMNAPNVTRMAHTAAAKLVTIRARRVERQARREETNGPTDH